MEYRGGDGIEGRDEERGRMKRGEGIDGVEERGRE